MIIVKLRGGLGNQLFQYAAGRCLAILNNTQLKLDLGGYIQDRPDVQRGVRIYGLANFKINASLADAADLQFLTSQSARLRGERFLDKIKPYYLRRHVTEPHKNYFIFDRRLLRTSARPKIYLEGYWQSEKYFLANTDLILKEFQVKEAASGLNAQYLTQFKNEPAVAVHVRHGDNATALAMNHGVLPLDYYSRAGEIIKTKVAAPRFYVFSDDINWAKANLRLPDALTFVDHNDDLHNYEDLRLMSACSHHIVGNSTFSWWGAWLAQHPEQIVVAPKRYYVNQDVANTDLYPPAWQLI